MEHSSSEGWKTSLVGGLIYSGPGAPSDGSAPSFSVSLNPDAATGSKQNGSRVEHQMDAATISALAASGAALVAATVAGVQFWMGRRQSEAALTSAKAALMNAESAGRHTVAEFRQKWIDKVIGTLCEHHSIIMTRPEGQPILLGDNKNLRSSRTKLEILLNPDEPNTVEFLKKIDDIDAAGTIQERDKSAAEMLTVARRLLKREWVRIKDELQ
jgi:hypothetical protein